MEELERIPDLSDEASRNEERFTQAAIASLRLSNKSVEAPDEDEQGNRYCLDCGDDIQPERVAAVQAVRCVVCQGRRERRAAMARKRGGVGMIHADFDGDDHV